MPSHVAASTVCVALTDTSGSVCSLSASRTPPAQVYGRLYIDYAVTRRCIDGVCGAHGHFRLRALAVGFLDAVSSDFGRLDTDRAITRYYIDGVCSTRTLQAPCDRCRLPRRRQLGVRSAGHRPCRQTSLHRRCVRRTRTLRSPCAFCLLPRNRQLRFRSAGHRPCRHTSLHRRCVRCTRTLQAPCARCRLPRRHQLSVRSAGQRPCRHTLLHRW